MLSKQLSRERNARTYQFTLVHFKYLCLLCFSYFSYSRCFSVTNYFMCWFGLLSHLTAYVENLLPEIFYLTFLHLLFQISLINSPSNTLILQSSDVSRKMGLISLDPTNLFAALESFLLPSERMMATWVVWWNLSSQLQEWVYNSMQVQSNSLSLSILTELISL